MTTRRNTKPSLILRIWRCLKFERKNQVYFLLVLMLVSSFMELITIGSVVPFLAALSKGGDKQNNFVSDIALNIFDLSSPERAAYLIMGLFVIALTSSSLIRLILQWTNINISFAIGSDISAGIYRNALYQPYLVQCSRNSSEIVGGITAKAKAVTAYLNNFLNIISSTMVFLTVLVGLLILEPKITVVIFSLCALSYIILIKVTRKRLYQNSIIISFNTNKVIQYIQEGLGGIRDILLNGNQELYCKIYNKSDQALRKASGSSLFIASSPRYLIEPIGFILLAIYAFILGNSQGGISEVLPLLGLCAMVLQRMLPVVQLAYSSWAGIRSGKVLVEDAMDLLEQPTPIIDDRKSLKNSSDGCFIGAISLRGISFQYLPNGKCVIDKLDLEIIKGSKVGIIGETGSGKSTLVDLIMGLHFPTSGHIEVDQKILNSENLSNWQAQIAHVPQSIFLTDESIYSNIAFGVQDDQIDFQKVEEAAKGAQIGELIESLPEKYYTKIGENGIRLSGGQRQRIGIARALYKKPSILILDEATSALDQKTEEAVMESIRNLSSDVTIIIIAHRLTTLKDCNTIVQLEDGKIKNTITYAELIK